MYRSGLLHSAEDMNNNETNKLSSQQSHLLDTLSWYVKYVPPIYIELNKSFAPFLFVVNSTPTYMHKTSAKDFFSLDYI